MYCKNCGKEVSEQQKFCDGCGSEINALAREYGTSQTISQTNFKESSYPMKWYKFLIYFALFFGAFYEFIMSINYMTGTIYFAQTNGQASAEAVYSTYGYGLKFLDVLYGILLLGTAVYSIITRNRLAKFKKNAPMLLYILYGSGLVFSLIYMIGFSVITGVNAINSSLVSSLISTIICLILNYKYFTKRESLFVN